MRFAAATQNRTINVPRYTVVLNTLQLTTSRTHYTAGRRRRFYFPLWKVWDDEHAWNIYIGSERHCQPFGKCARGFENSGPARTMSSSAQSSPMKNDNGPSPLSRSETHMTGSLRRRNMGNLYSTSGGGQLRVHNLALSHTVNCAYPCYRLQLAVRIVSCSHPRHSTAVSDPAMVGTEGGRWIRW